MCLAQLDHVLIALVGKVADRQNGPVEAEHMGDLSPIDAARNRAASQRTGRDQAVDGSHDSTGMFPTQTVRGASPAGPQLDGVKVRVGAEANFKGTEIELQHQ
jgi:hypothetical protein